VIALFTSGGIALLVAGFFTPVLLRFMTRNKIGQHIREDGPAQHALKAGTPTMGGIAIVAGIVAGYILGHLGTGDSFSRSGLLVVAAIVAGGLIGLADDWIKVSHQRSLGLNKRAKFVLQVAVGLGFAVAIRGSGGVSTNLSFTRYDLPGVALGSGVWIVWTAFAVAGSSNAVNLTDGLDGLAAGSSALAFSGLTLIGYWQFRHYGIYHLTNALDLALVAAAIAGACVGFLWWNAAPARIIMGDTGSLALGTGLAALCFSLNLQLLLPVIGGLFVIVTLSVIVQVVSFRLFHHRVFRMAPLHHHFELAGWPETTVTVRFWIFSALCTAVALGAFYADFLSVKGLR
jgi:phospho-N-acetylmuramoyl-pentapeptide-transferase